MTKNQLMSINREHVKIFDKYDSAGGAILLVILLLVHVLSIFCIFKLIFPFSVFVIALSGIVWFEALASLNTGVYRRYKRSFTDRLFIYDQEGKFRGISYFLFWGSSALLAIHFVALAFILLMRITGLI
jgi:hypothetical protein